MVVVFAKPHQALAIPPLFNFYYAQDLPIYSTSSIFKGFNDQKTNQDLDGVKITEFPLIVNKSSTIPEKYQQSPLIRMFAFGKDAFSSCTTFLSILNSAWSWQTFLLFLEWNFLHCSDLFAFHALMDLSYR